MTRITEPDLILPALYIIQKQPGITTGELIGELRAIFNPIGDDAEILQGRSDDKFSQIVRNLVSHHTLDQRLGYTILDESGTTGSAHRLTENGIGFLQESQSPLESLLSNSLGYTETINGVAEISNSQIIGKPITIFDENIFVSEGRKKYVTTKVYERSKALRDAAIKHYTKDDRIVCEACGFDFDKVYGDLGKGYIEVHHQKSIWQYEDTEFPKLIAEALKDLVPLCANCHRMVHRKKGELLSMHELREILANPKK